MDRSLSAGKENHSGHLLAVAVWLVIGAAIGALVVNVPLVYILAFFGAAGVVAGSVYKPELSVLIIVVIVSSIVYEEDLPLIPLGIGSLHIPDILMLILFSMAKIKRFLGREKQPAGSPLGKVLALFLLSATISVAVSIVGFGLDFNNVVRVYRMISYYLIFYIITDLITTKKQIMFLTVGLFTVAALVALVMLAQTVLGESVQLMPGRVLRASGLDEEFEAIRILPPGQTLVFITFIITISFAVYRRGKSLLLSPCFFLLGLLGTGVLLTYNRSYLVAVLLSSCFFLAISGTEDRKRLTSLLAGSVLLLILVGLAAMWHGGEYQRTIDSLSKRYLTLFAGKDLVQSSSLNDRKLENWYAVQQIQQHPVLGIGLGNDYRPAIYGPEDEITYYVHNVYLWLMLDLGLPGFLLFMVFFVGFLIRGVKWHRQLEDPYLKSIGIGALLAGVGMFPMALVIPLFMEWHSIVVIAIFIGLSETIIVNRETVA